MNEQKKSNLSAAPSAAQPLDLDKLDKLEALARAATPGPWTYEAEDNMISYDGYKLIAWQVRSNNVGLPQRCANGAYIAAANPATILALIAHARAAQPESATGTTGAPTLQPLETVQYWAREFAKDPQRLDGGMIVRLLQEYADLRAQLAAKGQDEQVDIGCLKEQSAAWYAVVNVLNEVAPGWQGCASRGMDSAAATIRNLAAPASAQPDRGAAQELVAPYEVGEGVAGLRPYEFSVCGKSLRWYLKRDVDALLSRPSGAKGKADAANAGGYEELRADWKAYSGTPAPRMPSPESRAFAAGWYAHKARCAATSAADAKDVAHAEMTPAMMKAVQLNSELGAYACANLSGAYDLFREFWQVAMAAAPSSAATHQAAPVACKFDGNGCGSIGPYCNKCDLAQSSAAGKEGS